MKYKAFVFDVDGTLVDSKKGEVPPSTIKAIHMLQEKGYPVIIATGRPLFCAPIVQNAGIEPDYFVGNNGTVVCDKNKKIIFEDNIKQSCFESLKQYCEDHKVNVFWKYHFGVCGNIYDENGCSVSKAFTNFTQGDMPKGKLPNAISLVCDNEMYLEMKEMYQDQLYFVDGGWLVFDVTNLGVSKVDGVKACLDYLHIDFSECMAFGDSENDLDMLKEAGLSICMGNGQDIVKKACDYVCDDVSNDGIYKTLKYFNIL